MSVPTSPTSPTSSCSLVEAFFSPRRVAVIGASNDPTKLSGRVIDFLIRGGFAGEVIPVNPGRDTVQGLTCVANLADYADGKIDVAVIAVSGPKVPQALQDCADAGTPAAIVFASGFAEMSTGRELQDEVAEICRRTGIRVLGPNCLGVIGASARATLTFSSALDADMDLQPGPVAIVAQSGAMATYLYSLARDVGLQVGHLANTGNEVDVTAAELLVSLMQQPGVHVGLSYLEAMNDSGMLDRLGETLRQENKTVVVIKAGRSKAGAVAASAHTGSVPVDGREARARLATLGMLQVESLEQAIDVVSLLVQRRPAGGRRLAVVSMSGGAGVLMADDANANGLVVNPLSRHAQDRIAAGIPAYGSPRNPVDMTAEFLKDPSILARTLDIVTADPDIDLVSVLLGNAERNSDVIVRTLTAAHAATDKPFVVVWTGGSGRPRQALRDAGVPTYNDGFRAAKAFASLCAARPSATTNKQ